MAELELRTCRLDRAGIPDLSDLIDIVIDDASIVHARIEIITNDADPKQRWHYPLATLELARHPEPVHVPLEATTRLEEAQQSAQLLRRMFRSPKT